MFQAFVIVCAASASFEIYEQTCIRSDDMWGPYNTQEMCGARATQMVDEVIDGPIKDYMFYMLDNPEQIYAEGYCEEIKQELAV